MTKDSRLSKKSTQRQSQLRRQPKQKRGKQRVEKILQAAAEVFLEVGYANATTHMIADRADTAIGSLYQFFPDKAAIFHAMELEHTQRVAQFWAGMPIAALIQQPLPDMMHSLSSATVNLLEHPVSRVVFMEFWRSRELFQSIDDSMTKGAIQFVAGIFQQRNPHLAAAQCHQLGEACVHSSNALIAAALQHHDPQRRDRLLTEMEAMLVRYLQPYDAPDRPANVMKVMKCPHCTSDQLSKNGRRRGKQCYLCKVCRKQFVQPAPCENIKAKA